LSSRLQRCSSPAIAAPGRPVHFLPVWRDAVARLHRRLAERHQRRKSVKRLQHLNAWLLRDIGIVRDDIEGEVDRLLSEQRFGMMGQTWSLRPDVERDWRVR
jgi:uncharacterized protein YjiS (DUF1127 family)